MKWFPTWKEFYKLKGERNFMKTVQKYFCIENVTGYFLHDFHSW